MNIVTGTVDDIDSLSALWTEMVEHHRQVSGDRWPVRTAEQAWAHRRDEYANWLRDGTGVLHIARPTASTDPLGYLFCRLVPSGSTFDLGDIRGGVESLVVAGAARGSGVGTALLQRCRADLIERGCTYWTVGVVEANVDAIRLYQRLGFEPWSLEMAAALE
jgi:ribosomal protein S18 acetylase RimI-like enzyme